MDESKETGGDDNASFESSNLNPEASSSVKELSPGPNSSEPGCSPKQSRGITSEKRSSSERESSSDKEKVPDQEKLSDVNKNNEIKEKTPEKTESVPEKKDKAADGKEKTQSKSEVLASSSSSGEKKRKLEISEEEVKQEGKKQHKQQEDRMKMQILVSNFSEEQLNRVLVSNFSEEQLNRYEMFRRATFPKAAIKRLMTNLTGTNVSQNVVIAMSGISKVFVGEVMETALDVMEKWEESGPLQPKHLREAVRILRTKNMIPSTKSKTTLF